MKESLRTRLKSGDPLLGTLVSLPAPEVAEILMEAGFDWFFVDLEHSPLQVREVQAILQVVDRRVDCVLRVPLNDEIWIKKALDIGAAGVMVPQINTAEEARRAVRFSKYPPQGTRSVGVGRAHGYGAKLQEYLEQANQQTAVIIQAEHIQAVENIEEILAVEGLDAVLVGPYDLSASMGRMGQVDSPEVQAAIKQVRQACLAHNMPLGVFTASAKRAKDYLRDGFRLVAASGDILMLDVAARELVRQLRD
jgi:2-keto-3-deoxy-L-rhamnonate aldolase RhmA